LGHLKLLWTGRSRMALFLSYKPRNTHLGTGTMGAGIVQVAAQAGYDVVACDRSVEALERAQLYVRDGIGRFARKGVITEDEVGTLYDSVH